MFISLKKRNNFIKRVSIDVWGHYSMYRKVNKAINFVRIIANANRNRYFHYKKKFVFAFQKSIYFRRRKRFKREFIYPRYLQNFYLVLTRDNFRRYIRKARKQHGYFVGNYLTFLECRLYMIVYRANFITNIFNIKSAIHQGFFYIQRNENFIRQKYHYNFILKLGDFLQVNPLYLNILRRDILLRFENNIILWSLPGYLYGNYNFMFVIVKRKPKLEDLFYPIRWFDPFIGSEYYMPS